MAWESNSHPDLPGVSVIVLNHNGVGYLEECFRSLEALNYPDDKLQLVLVDNASTDGLWSM